MYVSSWRSSECSQHKADRRPATLMQRTSVASNKRGTLGMRRTLVAAQSSWSLRRWMSRSGATCDHASEQQGATCNEPGHLIMPSSPSYVGHRPLDALREVQSAESCRSGFVTMQAVPLPNGQHGIPGPAGHSGGPRPFRRRGPTEDEWNSWRNEISFLYLQENNTLTKVMITMAFLHRFNAT